MASFVFADNARSTLASAIGPSATSLTVAPGDGAKFPAPSAGQQFALTLNDNATGLIYEVVYCTSRSGDVLTVVRGQEGTTPLSWNIGDKCWNGPTSGQMAAMVQIPHMTDGSISPIFANVQANGNLFVGGVTTHVGNVTNDAVTFFGTSGEFYANPNPPDPVINFAPSQYFYFQPGYGFHLITSGSIELAAAGTVFVGNALQVASGAVIGAGLTVGAGLGVSGGASVGGGLTVGNTLNVNAGNITALSGYVRASGGFNAGDGNACPISANWLNRSLSNPGYAVRGDGLMFEWGTQFLNGDYSVFENFPVAFPNACIGLVCTEGAAGGGWAGGTSPTVHAASGLTNTGWFHASVLWNATAKVWAFQNLTTNWMAVGF